MQYPIKYRGINPCSRNTKPRGAAAALSKGATSVQVSIVTRDEACRNRGGTHEFTRKAIVVQRQ